MSAVTDLVTGWEQQATLCHTVTLHWQLTIGQHVTLSYSHCHLVTQSHFLTVHSPCHCPPTNGHQQVRKKGIAYQNLLKQIGIF